MRSAILPTPYIDKTEVTALRFVVGVIVAADTTTPIPHAFDLCPMYVSYMLAR